VPSAGKITELLRAWSGGDERALAKLVPLVYDDLRQLARRSLRREQPGHTLQPTALVHEAYARLLDQNRVEWRNRTHFFAVAAQTMRRVLVDHARKRKASRRGGGDLRLSLDEALAAGHDRDVDLVSLDHALRGLTAIDAVQGRIVELRYFGGLTIEEAAEVLSISPATVKRDWTVARAWLYREMTRR
jgi:RNA polymerase sigma factor (TIGR02999 family)